MFFNINEKFHIDTDNEKMNKIRSNDIIYEIHGIETVHISVENNRVVILTRESNDNSFLYGFSLEGYRIFKVEPPKHYSFWYLAAVDKIACNAIDEFAEKSPLSGWFFSINLNTGELTKGSPAY